MNNKTNFIITSAGMSASDLRCNVEPVIEAVIDQTTFVVMRYFTSAAVFTAIFVVDMDKMAGVCVVQQEYFQVLTAILANPRHIKLVGKPVRFVGEDVPAEIAVFMTIAIMTPEALGDHDGYVAFEVNATAKQ
ncbi:MULTISPECIES: hypothetical protein [Burkholderiaceae]|uniref:Uncharacterized protein n=1 Tax=Burkholderia pseudomultivorans TaxID=1207504 RepID=A0ABU2E4A3_9BURK|nr:MULTISPECIES: hypothetical protein [Burkholderiaceae]MDN8003684.1 hypothetical protein [Burkholderia multivorans]MDR8725730.1 hypothetical protein [Burkholderia pseudomultivorans]MDR8733187.1 hypothetical protein [Burkholderia pseudomultivorans]MDR8742868.1 hypothetical protein [Burkholderia pseudomultivorans]MDR8754692.1 hypothetical protein [Burkholderia pseudomultivorans]